MVILIAILVELSGIFKSTLCKLIDKYVGAIILQIN